MKLNRIETLQFWLNLAFKYSFNSNSQRLRVGCVIIKENEIMSYGWNYPITDGMEIEVEGNLVTKPEVIHAEMNAIGNWMKNVHQDISTSTIFITHSPCLECAKLIYSVGLKKVVYCENYRNKAGIDFLIENGIDVEQISL